MAQKVVDKNFKIIAVILALVIALCHYFYIALTINAAPLIGAYFLITTILFAVGGLAMLSSGKLAKPAVTGLLVLSIIDSLLIIITRTTTLVLGRMFAWSTGWMPPGVVQVLILQVILIIIIGYKLRKA